MIPTLKHLAKEWGDTLRLVAAVLAIALASKGFLLPLLSDKDGPPAGVIHSVTIYPGKPGEDVRLVIDFEKTRPCRVIEPIIRVRDPQTNDSMSIEHKLRPVSDRPFPRRQVHSEATIPKFISPGLVRGRIEVSYEKCTDRKPDPTTPLLVEIEPFMVTQ